jgi:hypothetical protein
MARLIQPRTEPDSSADVLADTFKRHGFVAEAHALAEVCRGVGLDYTDPLDPLGEDLDRVVEHVADALAKLAPPDADADLLRVLEIYILQQAAYHGFRNWQPDGHVVAALGALLMRDGDLSQTVRVALATVKNGPVQLRPVVAPLLSSGRVDPLAFLDVDLVRTTTKRTGGSSWNQAAHDNDPRLPDFWLSLDPVRAFDAFRRLFEAEPIETLGVLALGLERQIGLKYPGTPVARDSMHEIEIRELYPHVEPLTLVLCRRRAAEGRNNDRTLTRCCWSYARLAGERAPILLGELYTPLARDALTELENVRKLLRGQDAEALLQEHGDFLTEAVFFGPRTDPSALWPVLRRLVLALREVPRRGVPLDLRTWDEHDPSFEKVPRPWNWVVDHIARVLELLLGRELERDADLNELRREFAKFCIERCKTRNKAQPDQLLTNEDFFEPKPEWRAAYINAAKELHPNLGERGHHALSWSRDHDPDDDARDAARSAAEVIRHGHGLPKNTSPRRAMFAAFWWLRQAHVVSLGEQVEADGAQRTFRKEMRRQANLDK